MKIQELLVEDQEVDLLKLIKRDCKKFLVHSKGQLALRGSAVEPTKTGKLGELEVKYDVLTARKDRKPRNMPAKTHAMLDDWFERNFQMRPRSEGIFTRGEGHGSLFSTYGPMYAMFPIGDFKFIWSPKVPDLYDKSRSIGVSDPEKFEVKMKALDWQTDDLHGALTAKKRSEVVFLCDRYYMVEIKDLEKLKAALA
jgi:hypothetical protein